jgi:hypothetical protein
LKKIGFILAILMIVVVALALRLYRFTPPPTLNDYTLNSAVQLPPGLHSDEAYNELAALRLLRTGELQPFFAIDQGRAAAHIYLTALVISIVGPIAEAGRLASLIAGLLSIAGMAWLTCELFRAQFSAIELKILCILAIAQIGFTYWFIHFGRLGFEQITVPLLMLPAFAAPWH